MPTKWIAAATFFTVLAVSPAANAQGIVGGAREGAATGHRVAGPVGEVVGGAVGAGVGGAVGAFNGLFGIAHYDHGRRYYIRHGHRYYH